MNQDDTPVQQYLRALESDLQTVPNASRVSILADVNAHIADALEEGRETNEVLAGLGKPEDVARDARDQFGASTSTAPADYAAHKLHVSGVVLAVVTAVFVSLQIASSFFENYEIGIGIALLTLLPAVLASLPLLLPRRMRVTMAWANAAIMTIFSVVAGFTLGGFFIPVALLMWATALVPRWIRRDRRARAGRIWRVIGALGIITPMAFAIGGVTTGTLEPQAILFIVAIVTFAIGVAFVLRVRFIDITVAIVGVAIMTLAMFDGGMLLLAVWWGGGFWLVVGLSALAAGQTHTSQPKRVVAYKP